MPSIYLRRKSGEILNTVSVGSATDPSIPKVIDGLWFMARLYGGPDCYVDDSEVNPKKPRRSPVGSGDPTGWESGLGSTEVTPS